MGSGVEELPAAERLRSRDPRWTWAPAGMVLAGCVLVPCLFTTRLDAVFVVPKLAALWALLALSSGVLAVGLLRSGRLPRAARPLPVVDVAVGVFLVVNVAAWSLSQDRAQSLYGEHLQYQGLLAVLLYVGCFYVARVSLTNARRLRLLVLAVAVGATLVAGYALVQKAGLDPIWAGYLPGGQVFSSIGQPNALAAYLVVAIPVCASLLFRTTFVLRIALLAALTAMLAALLFTHSRGGQLALLATLPVLALGWRQQLRVHSRRLAHVLALSLVVGTTIVALGQPARAAITESWERLASSTDFSGDASSRFHLDAWLVAARVAADHPVLGTGQETFPDVFPRYSHAVLPPERASTLDAFRVESPHNVYLGIASGTGLPALAAYLSVIAGFALAVGRAARAAAGEAGVLLVGVLAAALGHLVTDAFMTAEVTSTWLFWTLMGAALAVTADPTAPACQDGRSSSSR